MPSVTVEDRGGVAVLTLDRPPANAIDLPHTEELCGVIERVAASPPSALVLVGRGRFFCAGADLRAVPTYDLAQQRQMVAAIDRLFGLLHGLELPVVGAINGHAFGGGLIVALCCDWRVGPDHPDFRYGLPEVRLGIPYPPVAIAVVRTELSRGAARRLALGAGQCTAAEALALGVLDELLPPDQVFDRAMAVARELGAMPAAAYRHTKRALRGVDDDLSDWLVEGSAAAIAAAGLRKP